jgi:hypothetical protein
MAGLSGRGSSAPEGSLLTEDKEGALEGGIGDSDASGDALRHDDNGRAASRNARQ